MSEFFWFVFRRYLGCGNASNWCGWLLTLSLDSWRMLFSSNWFWFLDLRGFVFDLAKCLKELFAILRIFPSTRQIRFSFWLLSLRPLTRTPCSPWQLTYSVFKYWFWLWFWYTTKPTLRIWKWVLCLIAWLVCFIKKAHVICLSLNSSLNLRWRSDVWFLNWKVLFNSWFSYKFYSFISEMLTLSWP